MHDHDIRIERSLRDRRVVLYRIVRELRVQGRIEYHGRRVAHDDRVTVGWRFRDELHPNDAIRSGTVIDDHLVTERVTELLSHRARKNVTGSTRGVRDDEPD